MGLIGNNGAGKTTLMKILAQEKFTDLFTIKGAVINNCNFAYVPQLLDAGDKSGGQREKLALSRAIAKLKICLTVCCFWTNPHLIWILRSNNG
ncbi:hypothetical protein SDC49_10080 [Lactobacillus sp. R2/2]|nr:hypothetical protein [Lactobacillus sp. R2/2]